VPPRFDVQLLKVMQYTINLTKIYYTQHFRHKFAKTLHLNGLQAYASHLTLTYCQHSSSSSSSSHYQWIEKQQDSKKLEQPWISNCNTSTGRKTFQMYKVKLQSSKARFKHGASHSTNEAYNEQN
jgi:hypothetical protein